MSGKFVPMTEELQEYVTCHSTRRDAVLSALAEETARLGPAQVLQIAEQGQLRRACSLRAPSGPGAPSRLAPSRAIARLHRPAPCRKTASCCAAMCQPGVDRTSPVATSTRLVWARKIDLRIARRWRPWGFHRTISRSSTSGFIDADKAQPGNYYEAIIRGRRGGILCVDNVLRDGRVDRSRENDPDLQAVRALQRCAAA